jgi:hypothetical protein
MASGVHRGRCCPTYSITSTASASDGSGGKICVPRAMNSLSTSFCMNSPKEFGSTPCLRASATKNAAQM